MFGAKWRKGQAPADTKSEPAKPDETIIAAAGVALPTPAPEAAAAAAPAASEPARMDAAAEAKPATPGANAAPSRASRMVEVTRSRSSRLGRDLKAVLARREDWQKPAAAAAVALLVGGIGYAAGRQAAPVAGETAGRLALVSAEIGESRSETARLSAELKNLRTAFEGIRTERDRATNRQSQLTEKVERSTNEVAGRIGKLAEQLDRMEKAGREPARTAERPAAVAAPAPTLALAAPASTATPTSAAPTPPPKPTAGLDVTQTGSLAEQKPDPRRQVVDAYVLRDVDDGMALVEARNGRFFEVAPGMSLPGLGRVEGIERRGRQWVVLTPKGMVAPER